MVAVTEFMDFTWSYTTDCLQNAKSLTTIFEDFVVRGQRQELVNWSSRTTKLQLLDDDDEQHRRLLPFYNFYFRERIQYILYDGFESPCRLNRMVKFSRIALFYARHRTETSLAVFLIITVCSILTPMPPSDNSSTGKRHGCNCPQTASPTKSIWRIFVDFIRD